MPDGLTWPLLDEGFSIVQRAPHIWVQDIRRLGEQSTDTAHLRGITGRRHPLIDTLVQHGSDVIRIVERPCGHKGWEPSVDINTIDLGLP